MRLIGSFILILLTGSVFSATAQTQFSPTQNAHTLAQQNMGTYQSIGNDQAYSSCVIFMKMSTAEQLKIIDETNKKFGDSYTLDRAIADCTAIINAYNQASSQISCTSSYNCPTGYQCLNWRCEEIGGVNRCGGGYQCSPGEVCCNSVCKTGIRCE